MVKVKSIRVRAIEDDEIIKNMPQHVKVRNHLIRYGSITPLQAIELYNITRLAAIVYKLKNKIHPLLDIDKEMVYYTGGNSEHKMYAKYIFNGFKEENKQ